MAEEGSRTPSCLTGTRPSFTPASVTPPSVSVKGREQLSHGVRDLCSVAVSLLFCCPEVASVPAPASLPARHARAAKSGPKREFLCISCTPRALLGYLNPGGCPRAWAKGGGGERAPRREGGPGPRCEPARRCPGCRSCRRGSAVRGGSPGGTVSAGGSGPSPAAGSRQG